MISTNVNKLVGVATNLFGFGFHRYKDRDLSRIEAVDYCRQLEKKSKIKITLDYETILRENRREPITDYTQRTGKLKGNRAKYGFIPFEKRIKAVFYLQSDLDVWFEETIKPMAKVH